MFSLFGVSLVLNFIIILCGYRNLSNFAAGFYFLLTSQFPVDVPEAEDAMMGRHKLLTVSWRQYTAPKERHLEEDEVDAAMRMSPGWKFVDEIKQVFEKIRVIENDLGSPELHGGNYEEFSKQEDKIKVIWYYV